MASTNKTTNYELSQYIGTDKPTYLGDYNSDMSKIDTAMHTNADNITVNAGNITATDSKIGTLASLTTTDKYDVVSAINEVNSNANSNTTNIGSLSNLDTTNKSTIVNAINEVNSKTVDSYSSTETLTNKKWVDNSPVYRKVIDCGALPNATTKHLDAGIATNLSTIVSLQGMLYSSTSNFPLPYVSAVSGYNTAVQIGYNRTNDRLDISTMADMSIFNGFIIVEYTKTV